jgi:hypothetical protein
LKKTCNKPATEWGESDLTRLPAAKITRIKDSGPAGNVFGGAAQAGEDAVSAFVDGVADEFAIFFAFDGVRDEDGLSLIV